MSTTIDQAFVRQYESEVKEAYQRMGSKLRGTVRTKNGIVGSSTTFQKIGSGTASTKGRHGLITPMNIDHTPVTVTLADYYAGDYIDKLDELKIKHDERRVTVAAGAYALGRKTDELIVAALDGSTTYADSANLTALGSTATAASVLAVFTDLVTTLGARDVPFDGRTWGLVSWQVWNNMLLLDQFNRSEYVGGVVLPDSATKPRRWLDVNWMPHSGLTKSGDTRICVVYHADAVGHAIGADVMSDVTWVGERAAHFVNNMMSQGAGVIDAIGIQQFRVNEAA